MTELLALRVEHLSKTFVSAEEVLTVVRDVTFRIANGEICAIVGPSGSGKTTLLGLCAGLDRPTTGSVELCGRPLQELDEDALARLRAERVGFVFQNFHLLPTLTALENVTVPLELRRESGASARAKELLAQVGLQERLQHYPAQLSGGEQQRVALARAFIHHPSVLFADEPTGNLDAEHSAAIVQFLFELNHAYGTTLILVTHDSELASKAQRILKLKGGELVSDAPPDHS